MIIQLGRLRTPRVNNTGHSNGLEKPDKPQEHQSLTSRTYNSGSQTTVQFNPMARSLDILD